MLVASVIIYFVFSVFIYPRFFEKATVSRFLLVFFLCVFSINIAISEILGLLHLLNSAGLFLGVQTLICVLVSVIIHRFHPRSKDNFKSVYDFSGFHLSKVEILLVALISATFLGFFIIGITTPISNNDSLATHLTRIYYWLQHGSFDYWPASNLWQLIYPINAPIQGLWLFLLGKSENLFFIVQWFSLIVMSASVFEISLVLGFNKMHALISALVGLSFPVVLLQMFSFQGDLTVTALVMSSIVFWFLYHQSKNNKYIWIACFHILLALGTKQTAFLIVPMTVIAILIVLIKNRNLIYFLKSSWLLVILFFVFSGYQFIQNFSQTGSFFGVDVLVTDKNSSISESGQKALYVIPRYLYQFISADGLPRELQPALIHTKQQIFSGMLKPIKLDLEKEVFLQPGFDQAESFKYDSALTLSEDLAWFGPLAFLLLIPAIIFSILSKNKLRRGYALFCVANAIIYLGLLIVQRAGWDPYQGRYFILILYPFLPMVAILFSKKKVWRGIFLGILIPICTLLVVDSLLFNDSKPIITAKTQNDIINNSILPLPESNGFQRLLKKSLLKITYPSQHSSSMVNYYEATYYDRLFYSNKANSSEIESINMIIPQGEPISLMISNTPLEFALFGINRSRALYPIARITDAKSGYLITTNDIQISMNPTIKLIEKSGAYSIYYIN